MYERIAATVALILAVAAIAWTAWPDTSDARGETPETCAWFTEFVEHYAKDRAELPTGYTWSGLLDVQFKACDW